MHISTRRCSLALVSLLLIFLPGCKSVGQPSDNKSVIDELAKRELGGHYTVINNPLNTFALCQQQRSSDHLSQKLDYIVIRIADSKVIERGTYQNGHVKWIDDQSIEVLSGARPGTELKKKIITISAN